MTLFIHSSCVLCNTSIHREISLCKDCQNDLPSISHACKICGIPLEETSQICGQCLQSPPSVDYSISLYHYENPVDYIIGQLKFSQKLTYAAILGHLLKQKILETNENNLPDILLPVPLHKQRLIKRGFNQSLEITKKLAKDLNLPINKQLVKRKKATRAQSRLNLKQRKLNIKNCFSIEHGSKKVLENQHIVIIDDVVTTGATTNELAQLLKKEGAKTVGVWSIARAILH